MDLHALPAGTPAPDFTLAERPDRNLRLRDLRGRRVILAFYPADWSPVCGDQMALYNESCREFQRLDAQLLGISVDGVWCHAAFARAPQAPLPAPFRLRAQGRGRARLRRLPRRKTDVAGRALFVIDDDGVIRWSYVSPLGDQPRGRGDPERARIPAPAERSA